MNEFISIPIARARAISTPIPIRQCDSPISLQN